MNAIERLGPLAGRVMMAALFIPSGFAKLAGFQGTVGYIASKGLPLPQFGAVAAIGVELLVAAALLLGWRTRWAALVLALFTLAAAATSSSTPIAATAPSCGSGSPLDAM